MKNFLFITAFLFISSGFLSAQDENLFDIEIFIIDAYITPEEPNKLILTFFTSENCKTELVLNNKRFKISEDFVEDHKFELETAPYVKNSKIILYVEAENTNGDKAYSDTLELSVPEQGKIYGQGQSLFTICCLGGGIFGMPSPALIFQNKENKFSLTKEIPFISFYKRTYNFPVGYVAVEYSYIFKAEAKNFLRIGYKHIFEMPAVEYLSVGINGFTNFKGFNGVSPEISIGLFKIYSVFTLYTRYRYNIKPSAGSHDFHEASIGLYSSFFTFQY